MSQHFTRLASGTIGIALAIGLALPAAADGDRAWWIKTLREHQSKTAPAAQAQQVTSTTQQRTTAASARATAAPGTSTVASTQAAPRYRMVAGRVMPLGPTAAAQQRTVIRQAATAPAATRQITRQIDPQFLPTEVSFSGYSPGTIVIDTEEKYLYLAMPGGTAKRYGVGVGRPGFQWAGTHRISMKREWPGWTPPAQMRQRQPELPAYMEGGPDNPLGARALYLGSTLYRIHGSNAPWTIGHEVSSGCIRMRNEDVMDLYARVNVGTKVIVRR